MKWGFATTNEIKDLRPSFIAGRRLQLVERGKIMDAVQLERQLADFRNRWHSLSTQLTPVLHETASKVGQDLVRLTRDVKLALRSLDFDTVAAHVDVVAQLNRLDDDLDATWKTLSSSVQPVQMRQAIGEVSSELHSALLTHPSEEAEVLYNQGDQLVDRREYVQAIDKFTRAIQIRPWDSGYWFARAFAYSNLGNHDVAGRDGEMGCKLAPHRASCLGDLATIRLRAGDTDGALEAIETALQLDSNYQFGLELRSKLRRQIEQSSHSDQEARGAMRIYQGDFDQLKQRMWYSAHQERLPSLRLLGLRIVDKLSLGMVSRHYMKPPPRLAEHHSWDRFRRLCVALVINPTLPELYLRRSIDGCMCYAHGEHGVITGFDSKGNQAIYNLDFAIVDVAIALWFAPNWDWAHMEMGKRLAEKSNDSAAGILGTTADPRCRHDALQHLDEAVRLTRDPEARQRCRQEIERIKQAFLS